MDTKLAPRNQECLFTFSKGSQLVPQFLQCLLPGWQQQELRGDVCAAGLRVDWQENDLQKRILSVPQELYEKGYVKDADDGLRVGLGGSGGSHSWSGGSHSWPGAFSSWHHKLQPPCSPTAAW